MFRINNIEVPCKKDCTDRKVGCHSTCDKYLKYREETTAYNNRRRNSILKDNENIANIVRRMKGGKK
jgi:hypothetical protein